jgi:hypothetical protein
MKYFLFNVAQISDLQHSVRLFSKGYFPVTLEVQHNLDTSQYMVIFLFIRFLLSQHKQYCKCGVSAVQNRGRSVALYVTAIF